MTKNNFFILLSSLENPRLSSGFVGDGWITTKYYRIHLYFDKIINNKNIDLLLKSRKLFKSISSPTYFILQSIRMGTIGNYKNDNRENKLYDKFNKWKIEYMN